MQHHCLIKLCRDSVPSSQKLGGGLAWQNPAKQQRGDFIKQNYFFFHSPMQRTELFNTVISDMGQKTAFMS